MAVTGLEITGAGVVIAAAAVVVREAHAARLERKRAQPVVIAHEASAPALDDRGGWYAVVNLTNEGTGSAFNVTFGIELRGVRFPFRMDRDDRGRGDRRTVVRTGEDTEQFPIRMTSVEMFDVAALKLGSGDMDATRIYWAQYENAEGKTWETRNPGNRSAKLDIRRVRFLWARDRAAKRRRRRAAKARHRVLDQP